MSDGRQRYEAVVIGGGPAGAAAALTLARAGHAVALCERAVGEAFKVGESLPPAGGEVLRALGVAETLLIDHHQPCYGNQSAWGSRHLQTTDFIRDPRGAGWRLDRARFDAALREAACEQGVRLLTGTRGVSVARVAGGWDVTIVGAAGPSTLSAAWLVDASGHASWLTRQLRVERRYDDHLLAFVALFTPQSPDPDSLTLVEAAPDGWWYTARLPTEQRVVVGLTDPDTPMARGLRHAEGFRHWLGQTEHICARLAASGYTLSGASHPVPAYSRRLAQVAGDGWLAVGDAALSFDPLSSQGILTALYSGLLAGQALHGHLGGEADRLNRYEAQLSAVYDAYVRHRHEFYGLEQRWPSRPFWRRRHGDAGR